MGIFHKLTNITPLKTKAGFSLVEVLIALALFGVMATGFMASSLFAKRTAESALAESTALTVASGYMEQVKSINYNSLVASVQDTSIPVATVNNQGVVDPVYLNAYSDKTIPIRFNEDGSTAQNIIIGIKLSISTAAASSVLNILSIQIDYRWTEPGSGRIRTASLRSSRASVP